MNNIVLAGYLKKQIQKYEGGVDLESNKNVSISSNGTTVVQPSSGKDGMEQVTVSVNCPSPKTEQTKEVTITENGTTTVTPDSGKALSSVSITTNVAGGGGSLPNNLYKYYGIETTGGMGEARTFITTEDIMGTGTYTVFIGQDYTDYDGYDKVTLVNCGQVLITVEDDGCEYRGLFTYDDKTYDIFVGES